MRILVKLVFSVALVTVLGGGAFFGYNYYQAKDIFNNKVHVNKNRKDRPSLHDNKVNILLLGSDTRGSKLGKERADTILVANIDIDHEKINLMSIPRDTKVKIKNRTHKINQAHALGGPELMQEEVEELTGLEIDYFVETNFEGFKQVIDVIGGIKLDVERRMYKPTEDIDLQPGVQKLNGRKALAYVRWRGDARADLARVERQQKFLKTVLDQTAAISNLPKVPKIINAVGDNVLTDMSFDEIMNLSKKVLTGDYHFNSFTLPGEPKTIGGASYFVADEDAVKEYIVAMNEGNLTDDMMTNILAMTSKNASNASEKQSLKKTSTKSNKSTTKSNKSTTEEKKITEAKVPEPKPVTETEQTEKPAEVSTEETAKDTTEPRDDQGTTGEENSASPNRPDVDTIKINEGKSSNQSNSTDSSSIPPVSSELPVPGV